jgi:hypothetical protein
MKFVVLGVENVQCFTPQMNVPLGAESDGGKSAFGVTQRILVGRPRPVSRL